MNVRSKFKFEGINGTSKFRIRVSNFRMRISIFIMRMCKFRILNEGE